MSRRPLPIAWEHTTITPPVKIIEPALIMKKRYDARPVAATAVLESLDTASSDIRLRIESAITPTSMG
ncbi:hypothetical protein TCARB_0882 [Thermofilum adornatum 1505]|uniref:Uncharacterized protein n=1 Tax=Thermofilum adornatum 1505 TaxID=697581 RepID=A0A3G1A596_9CREN|nr:hypothetical protein TCARB_0882 [Thermofilum adornatum 1505]